MRPIEPSMNNAIYPAHSSNLCCLVYASRAARPYSDQELQALLQKSRFNNSRDSISGMLTYVKGMFFQMLEGPADKVEAAYRRILADARHHSVNKIAAHKIENRHFPHWNMGFPTPNAQMLARFAGYSDLTKTDSKEFQRLKTHESGIFEIMCDYARSAKAADSN